MAKKLYVGNLSYDVKNNDLQQLFAAFGNVVSADVIIDRDSGRSKGFGFVEMEDADAEKAIAMFHGAELDGRNLTVNEARPLSDRPPREAGFGGGRRSF